MNDGWFRVLVVVAALGSGLVGGIFFAFSTFVMKALGRLPAAQGIAAMQSINIAVITPPFMTPFLGTGLIGLVLSVFSILRWHRPGVPYVLVGTLLYLVGTILVTMVANVPLNNALARVDGTSAEGVRLWSGYVRTWTAWNHVRTSAALASAASFIVALFS